MTESRTYYKALHMSRSPYNQLTGRFLHPRHITILMQYPGGRFMNLIDYKIDDNTVTYMNNGVTVSIEIESIEELEPFAKSYNALYFTGGPTHEI
jgi:hypothetical protein